MNHYEPMPADLDGYDLSGLKVPPHSIEAEQSVIGGLLIGADFDAVAELVTAEDFYRTENRVAFGAIAKLAEAGQPIDLVTVCDVLSASGELDRAGGIVGLAEIAKDTPSSANVRAYAAAVRERAVLRNLIRVGQQIAESGFEPDGRKAAELIDEAQALVFGMGEADVDDTDLQINEVMKSAVDKIDKLFNSEMTLTGLSTGFEQIDARLCGLQPADMVIIAARPSMGKTTFAMNIVENAVLAGGAALVFSMEMPRESIMQRMFASVGRIAFERVRTGKLQDDEWPKLSAAISRLKDRPLFIDDRAGLSVQQMRRTARKLHRKCPLSLIMVDYLQLAKAKSESRVMEISEISRGLKALAKELAIPIVVLSQLNRSCDARPNKRPVLSDLRDSGAIEQDADVVMFIYRDEVYNEDSPDKGMAEIITAKQRNGPVGVDRLATNLHQSRFDNLARDWRPRDVPAVDRKTRAAGGFGG